MLAVEQIETIRRAHYHEHKSLRAIARELATPPKRGVRHRERRHVGRSRAVRARGVRDPRLYFRHGLGCRRRCHPALGGNICLPASWRR